MTDHEADVEPTEVVIVHSSRWFRPSVVLLALGSIFLVVLSNVISIVLLAPAVSRLTEQNERAEDDRAELADEVTRLRRTAAEEQSIEDCLALYFDDVLAGDALSQIALSDLFAAAVSRDPPLTEDERAAARDDNRRLVAELQAANEPLRAAVTALADYKAIQPPPHDCPHPDHPNGD